MPQFQCSPRACDVLPEIIRAGNLWKYYDVVVVARGPAQFSAEHPVFLLLRHLDFLTEHCGRLQKRCDGSCLEARSLVLDGFAEPLLGEVGHGW